MRKFKSQIISAHKSTRYNGDTASVYSGDSRRTSGRLSRMSARALSTQRLPLIDRGDLDARLAQENQRQKWLLKLQQVEEKNRVNEMFKSPPKRSISAHLMSNNMASRREKHRQESLQKRRLYSSKKGFLSTSALGSRRKQPADA